MNAQERVEFSTDCDEIAALSELSNRFPYGNFRIRKEVYDLSETIQHRVMYVKVYGYNDDGVYVWRNNGSKTFQKVYEAPENA